MTLIEALPELVADIEGALVRLGRGRVADQVRVVKLVSWAFDDFAQSTYLTLADAQGPNGTAEETISLYDDIGVNIELDKRGRLVGLEVTGYEESLSRLGHTDPK